MIMINFARHRFKHFLKLSCILIYLSIVESQSNYPNNPNLIKNFIPDSKLDGIEDFYDSSLNESANNHDYESTSSRYDSDCYDSVTGEAKKCMPEFVNAAFGLKITASNTCGQKVPSEYCIQTNLHGLYFRGSYHDKSHSSCRKCDFYDKRYAHPPEFLNDYNNEGNITWWQSDTMLEGIQYPNSVNLTLNLGKSFEINYVQIRFHSPRPESFAIYKQTNESSEWLPYQFYSASCRITYGKDTNQIVKPGNEAVALCTDEFSDIAPLTGASVVFGTLENRPSAYNFENTPELIEWVTATDIRITLNRLNTFGDEVFNDPQVLKSYYYAISDIAVGGRCKCNGHASRCIFEQQQDFEDRLKCKCEHYTDGPDCNVCLPFYNDVPWSPATQFNGHECKRICDQLVTYYKKHNISFFKTLQQR
ncbi:laminin subunit gamma-1 [Brachionus plicatilis]|uniref:Laminin subunit gamma-1 n=1 Tax=Brachionus plicatilis TaxID=10195 RepID=A0A3M7RCT5_BRAPC|nr:laminin subunit gamma-1 [Brachionus plicatilis]